MYENFVSLVKAKSKYFIDTRGNCFYYYKKKYVIVKPMKIKSKEFLDYYCRVWLVGHNSPFILKSAPLGKDWAHMLLIDHEPWLIYDFSDELCDSYKRMI